MAAFGARTDILHGGIATVEVRVSGTNQTWYTLPFLRDVKVVETPLFVSDTRGRNVPYAYKFECTGKCLATGSATNFFPVLDDLTDVLLDAKVVAQNGTIWDTAGATGDGCGFYWRLVSEGDMDAERYLEFRIDRTYLLSDADAFHTAQSNTETGTDAELAKLENLARTDIAPAGISAVAFGVGNVTDYVLSYIRNARFTAETKTTMDQYGRSLAYAVKVDFAVDAMPSLDALTTSDLLDTLNTALYDVKLTFADGRTAEFNRNATEASDESVGFMVEVHNETDADDIQFLRIVGSGTMTAAKFAGIWA
jgi:hypothetical protein